ncbi:autophagy-related protein 22-like protein [Chytriomyces sp. MP71]|nr:autophagy-related protein 22-like protein [Chytriomyces sp. MP71]
MVETHALQVRPSDDTLHGEGNNYVGGEGANNEVMALLGFDDVDPSPVHKAEMTAWLVFGASCSPVTGVAFGFFIPLIIQALASGSGWEESNHSIPCNTNATQIACVVKIGNIYIDTSSFYFSLSALSAFIQMLLFITFGSLADHGAGRKNFMLNFAIVGAIGCLLFPAITRNDQVFAAALLSLIVGISVGMCWVFVYSYLPVLARASPAFQQHTHDKTQSVADLTNRLDVVTNEVSARGFVWSGSSDLLLLVAIAALGVVFKPAVGLPSTYALQLGIAVIGLFWLVGIAFAYKYLKSRPGPPMPAGANVFTFSTKKVIQAVSKARELPNLFIFLLGWFLYSDAIGTLSTVAILLAQSLLGFTTTDTLILGFEVFFLAVFGVMLWKWLQVRFNISSKHVLQIQTLMYLIIPAYGMIGLIPGAPIGFKTKIEVYIVSAIHGLNIAATQSTSRSVFSQMLPPGEESQFFSLYEITDKGSSWIGPLVVAQIDNYSSNKNNSFIFIAAVVALALVFFSYANVEKGIEEGRRFAKKEAQ